MHESYIHENAVIDPSPQSSESLRLISSFFFYKFHFIISIEQFMSLKL